MGVAGDSRTNKGAESMTLRESLFLIGGIFGGICIGAFWAFRIVFRNAQNRIADLKAKWKQY